MLEAKKEGVSLGEGVPESAQKSRKILLVLN